MSFPWSWPPASGATNTDLVANRSSVAGATATAALNALNTGLTTINTSGVANASSVPGATATAALNELGLDILALQLATVSPYIPPPAVANAFDDEFSSGSADLATRGYTVVNAGTGVVQTRNGNIDPWGSAPPAGTYNSTIINSWLFVQAPPAIQIDIYKAITLAAGDTFFARTVGTYNLAPAAGGRFQEVGLYAATGAQLDGNNRVYSGVRDDPSANCVMIDAGRFTAAVFAGTTARAMLGGHDIRGVHYDTGTTHTLFAIDALNGEPKAITVAGAPAAANLVRFGVRNLFSTSGSAVPQIWGIDFIRRKVSNAWLIS